jgi:hypothetical protein
MFPSQMLSGIMTSVASFVLALLVGMTLTFMALTERLGHKRVVQIVGRNFGPKYKRYEEQDYYFAGIDLLGTWKFSVFL